MGASVIGNNLLINEYSRRLATNLEQIRITIITHGGKILLYSLSISFKVFINLTMGASVIGDNLLINEYSRRLATNLEQIRITIISHGGKILLYSLSNSFKFS